MALLILFFVISILVSFLCSIWEAVLLSITPSFVHRLVRDRPAIGKKLNHLKQDIDKPLSAILTLNTIAHTVGAIGVGVQAGKLYGTHHIDLHFVELTYESIIAGLMTLAILILSEIIPKTLGASYWKNLTPITVQSISVLVIILYPFVWMSNLITRVIKSEKDRSVLSRADFAAMADAGLQSGAIDSEEKSIIQNLLRLENLNVRDIMTPRSVVLTVNEDLTLQEVYSEIRPLQFSRIPVFKKEMDNITGLILKDIILENLAEDKHNKKASEIKREIIFVDDSMSVAKLMDTLILKHQHLAMVADKFGTMVGLVTMEDVFETLLGLEIVDETDKVEDMQKLAREKWMSRAGRNKK